MDVEPKRETDVLSDPITTQMEDTCAMGTKRPLEDEDEMVEFMEILTAEAQDVNDDEIEQTGLETGE